MTALDDLRRRVEALEARAAAEESSAPDVDSALLRTGTVTARHLATIKESLRVEPAHKPASAADRPLWKVMQDAHLNEAGMVQYSNSSQPVLGEPDRFTRAAEIDAVADWLDAHAVGVDAVVVLHAEARRAREGA